MIKQPNLAHNGQDYVEESEKIPTSYPYISLAAMLPFTWHVSQSGRITYNTYNFA